MNRRPILAHGWVVTFPDGGSAVFVSDTKDGPATEADAWRIALGWPTRGEVRQAQQNGAQAHRCYIIPVATQTTKSPDAEAPGRMSWQSV